MQTLIAYAFAAGYAPLQGAARDAWQREAVARVDALDAGRWAHGPRFEQAHSRAAGVLLWESEASPSLWPAWCAAPRPTGTARAHGGTGSGAGQGSRRGHGPDNGGGVGAGPEATEHAGTVVASIYAPLGYSAVTGSAPIERAPLVLGDALVADPTRMFDITPPFVLTRLDVQAETLDIFTDVLGVGRLFELATPWGWVWSNRAIAALRFADRAAVADEVGWAQSAVADEFFGALTPYEGVRVIDAATRIHIDGRTGTRLDTVVDTVSTWSQAATSTPDLRQALAEQAADSLRVAVASMSKLYGVAPTVDLSGGRDSRLVASAFVAAGADFALNSHDAVPGDLSTAIELVALLGKQAPEHLVRHRPTGGTVEPPPLYALESARRWHEYADGLRPCTFIAHTAPAQFDAHTGLVVGGVGGELAHGFFYPGNVDALDLLPLPQRLGRYASSVLSRQGPVPGAGVAARNDLLAHIRAVLGGIADRGFTDARALDVYYMRERLRRWGSTGERIGTVSPLLSPSFVAAALALTPEARRANSLHRDIVRRLVPQWADVPFFPGETPAVAAVAPTAATAPKPQVASRVMRLADAADADDVASLLADPSTWGTGFDVPTVHRYWHASREGTTTGREERVLRSAVWRAAFEDVLADADGTPRNAYAAAEPPKPAPAPVAGPASAQAPGVTEVSAGSRGRHGSAAGDAPRQNPKATAAAARRAAVTGLRRNPLVRRVARSQAWIALRNTPVGDRVRRSLRG